MQLDQINSKTRGFTLLEVLVVLVLVGLISTVTMQGFSFVLNLQERLKRQLVDTQYRNLQESWFRDVVRSFREKKVKAGEAVFTGSPHKLEGFSLLSLKGRVGVPIQTQWLLEEYDGGQYLKYSIEGGEPVIVADWLGADVIFQYLDRKGQLHNEWPPSELVSYLPKGILLSSPSVVKPLFWYVSVSNTEPPPVDLSLIL